MCLCKGSVLWGLALRLHWIKVGLKKVDSKTVLKHKIYFWRCCNFYTVSKNGKSYDVFV